MSSTQEVGEIFGEGSGPAHAMLRSPTVLIASVGLWGLNILMFRIFGINYKKVLKFDLQKLKNEEKYDRSFDRGEEEAPVPTSVITTENVPVRKFSKKPSDSSLASMTGEDHADEGDHAHHGEVTPNDEITWNRLVSFSVSLLFLLHYTTYVWMEILGGGFIGAIFSFYGSVLTVILLPIPSLQWLRKAFVITFQRMFELINPRCHCLSTEPNMIPRPIPFVDVYFADAMCSLSKVFFDLGMLLHMASHFPEPVPPSMHNILIPSACAAIPYIIRARQCLVMHTVGRLKNDPKRGQHIANAIKYSTSLFPLFLSAYQKTIAIDRADHFEPLLIILLFVNASYSLYWDIVMDWGMMQNPKAVLYPEGGAPPADCTHGLLRPRLRFGLSISLLIVITDCILRFSWTLRFWHAVFPSGDSFVLCTQFLEIFRRAIWNLLRVEWENIKQQKEKAIRNAHDDEDSETGLFFPPTAMPTMTAPVAKRPNSGI